MAPRLQNRSVVKSLGAGPHDQIVPLRLADAEALRACMLGDPPGAGLCFAAGAVEPGSYVLLRIEVAGEVRVFEARAIARDGAGRTVFLVLGDSAGGLRSWLEAV